MPVSRTNLTELYATLPECGLNCLLGVINNQSSCSLTDVECTCANQAVQATTAGCVAKSCTTPDGLRTQNLTNSLCGITSHREYSYVAVSYTFVVMASVFVALRFAARLTNGNPLWLDDYFILISTLISISYSIFTGIGDRLGAGLDLWAVPQENLPTIYKLVLAGTVVSVIARGFIRVSVSMFLMRIFSVSTTRRPIILTLVLNVAITVAFTICIVFECTPISHFWDGWDGLHKGTCVNQWDMFLACSCIATTLDVILILLPMRWISQLQFPHSKKIATLAMFAISAIVIAISIVRILYLLKLFTDPASATRTLADLVVWGNLEIYVAIICACLPSLRPLLKLALSLRLVATHRVKARSSWPLDSTGQQMSSESRRRLPSDDIQYPDVDKVVNRSPNIWLTTTVQQQYEERSYPQSETNFTRAAINGIELHDRHQAIPRGGSWT